MVATKTRLADALTDAGLTALAAEAARGQFDDYESPLPFPLVTLVHQLQTVGTPAARALADRVMDGDFDGTKEEAEAWFELEGKAMLGDVLG